MFFGNNIEYEDFEDYLLNGDTVWDIHDLFDSEEEIEEVRNNSYFGSYNFSIVYSSFKKIDYKFVFAENVDNDYDLLRLIPIDLPDDKIFDYWARIDENGNYINSNEILDGHMEIRYTPYLKSTYQIENDEIIKLDGNIGKIQYEDFIEYNGLKYEVLELNVDEKGNPNTGIFFYLNEFYDHFNLTSDDLKNNNYNGIYQRTFVRNTGEQYTENYIIVGIENEKIFFEYENDTIPLSLNTPELVYRKDGSSLIVQHLIADSFLMN